MFRLPDWLSSAVLVLVATGAQAQAVPTYPKAASTAIFVATETVSTWTETVAEDYNIPNSQVFVTGQGSDGAKYMGLLGVAIARSRNESATGTAGASRTYRACSLASGTSRESYRRDSRAPID